MITNDDINFLIRRYREIAKAFREDGNTVRTCGRTNIARAESFEIVAADLERMLVWREGTENPNQKRKEIGLEEILWPN